MISLSALRTNALATAGAALNRTLVLPVLFFSPTSRCNSRCVTCDWWQHSGDDDLGLDELDAVTQPLRSLGTRLVVFTGGEPLLRREIFEMAARFRSGGARLWLLTSGLALARLAREVAEQFDRVTISLDAAEARVYEDVRGVDALEAVARGVA